ncbi:MULTISPECIES: glycosyltransferase family 39 protein [Bacillus]|uniref:glycosyltransferase family 39 protein n=1 Tax=Bacillus TaxID=1386 RepID=UPI00032F41B1|nr:glycosyltransferase family 39 protein [Bacillus wiedmannii]EOP06218.1 hypothetical protein ICS_04715 [Bacillus cereus BAG2O-3]EOQ14669.1 hypothetical protein KQ3_00176 [Bacillus cereus B5-2]EOQ34271.1 hypothetical protein KQ1_00779 [Bacillus cereus BAG3O-1]MBJ8119422.1 glycosyltransferase family 39 protein [Bacillus cereus]PFW82253.1 hypothetical protein COL27_17390 [Bacillus sp. AFS075960]RFB11743.1 hypothetical protein DZB88_18220 [Bacillus sp. OE]RFB28001.1 hypothetical protein DZB85_0
MPRLYAFAFKSLQILTLLFFAMTLIYSLQFLITEPKYDHPYFLIVALIVVLIGIIFMSIIVNRFFTQTQFIIFICLLAFTLRLAWVLTVQTNVVQDFEQMYNGAVDAANNNFSFADKAYFTTWVYQLGFTMYQAGVIKLFGEGVLAIKLLNILYCTGITYFIYRIATHLFNEFSGRVAALIFATYIPNIMMTSVLTNQHLATFLFYGGFYLLVKKGISHSYAWIFVSILIAFGDIMRPIGIVILLALILFLLITHIIGDKKLNKKMVISKLIGMIGIYYIVHFIFSYTLIATGVTQYPLSSRDPYWKFVVGFNPETTGGFSFPDHKLVFQYPIGEERFEIEKQLIKERTADKGQLLLLFKDKFKIMWGDYDAAIYWGLEGHPRPELSRLLWTLEKLCYVSICIFACIASIKTIKEQRNKTLLFFSLLILGYVGVHFFIEIQSRYRYFIIPTFMIIQGYGVYLITQYIKERFQRKEIH